MNAFKKVDFYEEKNNYENANKISRYKTNNVTNVM